MDMRIRKNEPPREFRVGDRGIVIRHCADVELGPDEQVTFVAPGGSEYDVVRKAWGYYATPSLDGRLADKGLRGVLVQSEKGRLFVILVERGREAEFDAYRASEQLRIVSWLDSGEAVAALVAAVESRASEP
jgi:hypothetical protein